MRAYDSINGYLNNETTILKSIADLRHSLIVLMIGGVFGDIRNCFVPFDISSETESNISSTRWRSVSDFKK